jgi:glutamine synthetase
MIDMVKGYIIPASVDYQRELVDLLRQKKAYGGFDTSLESHFLGNITRLSMGLFNKLVILENVVLESKIEQDILTQACFYRDKILTAMSDLRQFVDEIETFVAKKHWPIPAYAEILYSVI